MEGKSYNCVQLYKVFSFYLPNHIKLLVLSSSYNYFEQVYQTYLFGHLILIYVDTLYYCLVPVTCPAPASVLYNSQITNIEILMLC